MSDIVVRLLDVVGFVQKEHGRVAAAACLAEEAADEITRLRAEVKGWARREREVIDAIPPHYLLDPPDGGDVELHEGVQRMAAENEQLRAALEDVLSYVPHGDLPLNLYDKARAALAAQPAPKEDH